jgi:hypothetical protein
MAAFWGRVRGCGNGLYGEGSRSVGGGDLEVEE